MPCSYVICAVQKHKAGTLCSITGTTQIKSFSSITRCFFSVQTYLKTLFSFLFSYQITYYLHRRTYYFRVVFRIQKIFCTTHSKYLYSMEFLIQISNTRKRKSDQLKSEIEKIKQCVLNVGIQVQEWCRNNASCIYLPLLTTMKITHNF